MGGGGRGVRCAHFEIYKGTKSKSPKRGLENCTGWIFLKLREQGDTIAYFFNSVATRLSCCTVVTCTEVLRYKFFPRL